MITSAQYAVTDAPVKIAASPVGVRVVHVAPIGNTTVYLGGTNAVTSSTGYGLNKSLGEHDINLGPGDEIWAVCSTGQTETVTILVAGN